MIDLYYAPTPNGWKISIMLEETATPYNVIPVNLGKGDQFKPEFLAISPNNRMPAIVDHEGPDGKQVSIFESGAILMYLGEKTGQFFPQTPMRKISRPRVVVLAGWWSRSNGRSSKSFCQLRTKFPRRPFLCN